MPIVRSEIHIIGYQRWTYISVKEKWKEKQKWGKKT